MGLFRLLLAALVALSHTGLSVYGFNPGVVAVISFFLLSGFVMSMLIEKYYKQPSAIPTFYLDRAVRLFPQFLFYMAIASVCIYFLNVESPFTAKMTITKWTLNFFILPQGFYMYWADGALVIPQTWSLGLEFTFYLVIPLILIYLSARQIYLLAAASFLIFLTAYFGKINTDEFGYRLLPGTLFMFLIGWSFFKNDRESKIFRFLSFTVAGILLVFAYLNEGILQRSYNKEVLLGLLIGILAISYMKHFSFSSIDEFLGNLSYGVFLNHFIVIWIMQKYYFATQFHLDSIAILLLSSCALAFISYFYIERPALKWRHSIRTAAAHSKIVRSERAASVV